jgi:hypothetical protein
VAEHRRAADRHRHEAAESHLGAMADERAARPQPVEDEGPVGDDAQGGERGDGP